MNRNPHLDALDVVHPADLDRAAAEDAGLAAALEAVRGDDDLSTLFAERTRFDEHVSRLATDVPAPPADLRDRILSALEAEPPVKRAAPPAVREVTRRGLLRGLAATVGLGAAAALGIWASQRPQTGRPTLLDLRTAATARFDELNTLPPFEGDRRPPLPHGWRGGMIRVARTTRGLALEAGGPQVASVHGFRVVHRGRTVRGVLLALPTESLADPPSQRFFDPGSADYTGPFDSVAWTEGNTTYVCLVHDGDLNAVEAALNDVVPV